MASTTELVTQSVGDLTVEPPPPKTFLRMSLNEKIRYIRDLITVEPLVACYVIGTVLASPPLQNLELEKACRVNLAYNGTVCEAILAGDHDDYKEYNDEVQIAVSRMHAWQNPMQQVIPLVLILFLGSYSDRRKVRKPFMLIPIFGEFFAVAALILCVVFMDSWPLEAVGFAQTVLPSFFGSATTFFMAVFAYIADVSSVEMRTLRVGVVQIVLNVVQPIVNPISGILYANVGYIGSLVATAVFYALGIVYAVFYVKEKSDEAGNGRKESAGCFRSFRSKLKDIFDPRSAIDTFSFLLKKIPGNNRVDILLVLFVFFVTTAVNYGEFTLMFLFTQSVLAWTPLEFSFFATVNIVVHLFGTAVGLPIFTKLFRWGDYTLIILSFLDKVISNIVYTFSTKTNIVFYVATVISVITSISVVALRSAITKIVTEDNLGKALSLFGICESLAGAVGVPVYNEGVYVQTVENYPQAFFYVGSVLHLLLILVVLFLIFKEKRKRKTNGVANGNKAKGPVVPDGTHTTHM